MQPKTGINASPHAKNCLLTPSGNSRDTTTLSCHIDPSPEGKVYISKLNSPASLLLVDVPFSFTTRGSGQTDLDIGECIVGCVKYQYATPTPMTKATKENIII